MQLLPILLRRTRTQIKRFDCVQIVALPFLKTRQPEFQQARRSRQPYRARQERQLRRQIDGMLLDAVESGATVVMDNADWASIRKAARAEASKPKRKK